MNLWLNIEESAGMLAAIFLVFSGLWFGFPGPAFQYFLHRAARGRHARRGTS